MCLVRDSHVAVSKTSPQSVDSECIPKVQPTDKETDIQCVKQSPSECDKNLETVSQSFAETQCDTLADNPSQKLSINNSCFEKKANVSPSDSHEDDKVNPTEVKVIVENSQGEEEDVFNITLDVGSDEEKELLDCDETNLDENFSVDSNISLLCKEDLSSMPLDNTIPKNKRKYSDEENKTDTQTLASETFQDLIPAKKCKGIGRSGGPAIFAGRSSGYYFLYTSVYKMCEQARVNNLDLSHMECHINSILGWQPMDRFFLNAVKNELLMLLGDDAVSLTSELDNYVDTGDESEPEEASQESDAEQDPDESGNESALEPEESENESGPETNESGDENDLSEEVISGKPVGENCENTESSEASSSSVSEEDFEAGKDSNSTPSTPVFGQRAPTFSTPFAGMCTQAIQTPGSHFTSTGSVPSFSSFSQTQLPSPIKPVGGKAASYITPVETVRAREEKNAARKQSSQCTPCTIKQSTPATSSVPSDPSPSPTYKFVAASSEEKAADPGLMGHYYLTDQRKVVKLEVRLPKSTDQKVSSQIYIL